MRFHVVGLPHTQTTLDYTACAFTEKVRKFCIMMKDLGHTVYLYAGEQNEAPCDELITCITEEERKAVVGDKHYIFASFDYSLPFWLKFNQNVIDGIKARAEPTDFICVIGGLAHKQIADALPDMMTVEFGIGYGGTFAKYRVWESYAWMHTCYGSANSNPNAIDGLPFDEVIPSYIEPNLFPFEARKDDYYLFIGRLTERKGYGVAIDACKQKGTKLLIAGQTDPGASPPDFGEYLGVIGAEERGFYMSRAKAVFVPTQYIEPFGTVVIEAHACGTPTITTDWGAFTETVQNGINGYRCRSFQEFLDAMENCKNLDPERIRRNCVNTYSLDVIGLRYQKYFERLSTLWGRGWYELRK
jgi:glycosyltransferase involved in cell wall biosynthesis